VTEGENRLSDERKRYTTRLQRRAQAHVTAVIGQETVGDDLERQIAMVIQHVLETTGARRVTLFRPLPKGQRWYSVTLFDDGGYFYGPIDPEALLLPMMVYNQKSALLLGPGHTPPDMTHLAGDLARALSGGTSSGSYLGLPLLAGSTIIGVIEVVDVEHADQLEHYAASVSRALEPLAASFNSERPQDLTPPALLTTSVTSAASPPRRSRKPPRNLPSFLARPHRSPPRSGS